MGLIEIFMGFWVISTNAFLIMNQIILFFHKPLRNALFLSAPILIVFASLLFWLVKVYISKRFRLAKNKARVKA